VTVRIALDAMGGDHAPGIVLEGAVDAVRQLDVAVVLVGPEAVLRPQLVAAAGGEDALSRLAITLVDAPEVVGMDELPIPAIRRKKKSSILVGLRLVRDGAADAFVSAGNTGAIMAAATLVLRKLPGVERPALAAMLPNRSGGSVLVDVGANVEVKPKHLEQFAVMGRCFVRAVRGIENPRVALLSIGEEEVKGNDLIRQVHQDLKRAHVNFVGNIDGKAVYSGFADVIVTDGFTGNAVLKASESLVKELTVLVRTEIDRSLLARIGMLLALPAFRRIRRQIDHAEYGAVPLLGVSHPVFIGHGSSSARSIRSAVRVAARFVEARVSEAIQQQILELADSTGEAGDEAVALVDRGGPREAAPSGAGQ
jgi:glycerol-3-phosphate acyltransferase PlsX